MAADYIMDYLYKSKLIFLRYAARV